MSQENVELARRAYQALNRDGVEAILEFLDPEIDWIAIPGLLPDAENFHGHAGVRRWFAKVAESFDQLRWEPEEYVEAGDRLFIAVVGTARGRSTGIVGSFKTYQAWTIRAGQAVRLEAYLERSEALEAAGLSEQNARSDTCS